jgi:xylulokinase
MEPCFIGIDLGTSGVKVIAVDRAGGPLASATEAFDFDRPRPGWTETRPELWWQASARALRAVVARLGDRPIAGVGMSGQMHGSVFLDEGALAGAGRRGIAAIRPALMWNDQRTEPQRAEIDERLGGRRASVERTGCPALCGLTAPKLLWFREQEPELAARLATFCMPKDFIVLNLTGALSTDVGEGSGTMLFDNEARAWNRDTLDLLGIDPALLPPAHESCTVVGEVTEWAASISGIPAGTPVATGSGDNQAAAIGAGVVDPGEVLAILGTSGVVLAPSGTAGPDLEGDPPGRLNLFCDSTGTADTPGGHVLSGCMLSAAGSLEWARSVLAPGVPFEEMLDEAAAAPPGCDGLVFLPYLTGERCPIPDPDARGGWIGLTRGHTRAHLVRAVLEGVSFGLAQILDIARDVAGEPALIRLTGGGAKSPLWRRIIADAFGLPVATLEIDEGSALGAAAMGACAVGAFPDARAVADAWVTLAPETAPDPPPTVRGARVVYDRLYTDLTGANELLAEIERSGG